MDNLVMYLIVTCDDETSVSTYERVMHRRFLQATITFLLKVSGVNFITRT